MMIRPNGSRGTDIVGEVAVVKMAIGKSIIGRTFRGKMPLGKMAGGKSTWYLNLNNLDLDSLCFHSKHYGVCIVVLHHS